MKTVWKIPMEVGGVLKVALPAHSKFLHFGWQNGSDRPQVPGSLFAWFEVRPNNKLMGYKFTVIGTGHQISDSFDHLASTQVGPFVWHLYKYYNTEEIDVVGKEERAGATVHSVPEGHGDAANGSGGAVDTGPLRT